MGAARNSRAALLRTGSKHNFIDNWTIPIRRSAARTSPVSPAGCRRRRALATRFPTFAGDATQRACGLADA
jgi:hypothetical protein